MERLPRVVAVTGFRKSGKTMVIEGLVKELSKRGYRVGTIKHIRERDFTIDEPGKDTWRHGKAGARVVACLAPRETAVITKRAAKPSEALGAMRGLHFVLMEGFRGLKGVVKIAAARNAKEASKLVDKFTVVCVGYGRWGLPVVQINQSEKLADIVERRALPLLPGLNCKRCGYPSCEEFVLGTLEGRVRLRDCQVLSAKVRLAVDGREVELNAFMQELIAGVVTGMTSSLKKAKGREIELKVTARAR